MSLYLLFSRTEDLTNLTCPPTADHRPLILRCDSHTDNSNREVSFVSHSRNQFSLTLHITAEAQVAFRSLAFISNDWRYAKASHRPLSMSDVQTAAGSPPSPTHNARRTLNRSPRSTSFKRKSAPAGTPLKAIIPEDSAVGTQDMAASFLQYCAMCEKQILTPSNSILYCSEACRRKDSCKPLALAAAAMSPTTTPPSSAPSSPRPILPPRTPTGTSSVSAPSIRTPAELHNAKSDLDPTEWKPKLHRRGESEASQYLAQFHRSTSALGIDAHDEPMAHRPLFSHRSTTSIASMTTPSLYLSQTPTTASSSLSTGPEYDFNTRPLQSRHNPMYSTSTGTTKGIDLVMPFVAPSMVMSLPRQVEDRKYEKRSVAKMSTSAGEGLAALIGREG